VRSQDTAQKVLNSLSLMMQAWIFSFRSTTCMKFCCKNLVTDFSQQMIILNLLTFSYLE